MRIGLIYPNLTLWGDTSGGPPTTSFWTRNGHEISNNDSFNITVNYTNSEEYRSILTMTSILPGTYQSSVINRATANMVTGNVTVEGKATSSVDQQ